MKENPGEQNKKRDMEPGRLVLDGFLGADKRQLQEIIEEDRARLDVMGVSAAALAKAMRTLTREGMRALGQTVRVEGFDVSSEEFRGWLGCPFKDAHRAAKRITTVTDPASGQTMAWSDLHIHLIEDHGFFQGAGSAHRLEPEDLVKFLKLAPEVT